MARLFLSKRCPKAAASSLHQPWLPPLTTRSKSMNRFDGYRDSFPNARLTRSESGVLEVALHTDGGTLVFNGHTHEQFVDLFHAIGADRDNRVVILTGSGAAFMESISPDGFDFFSPQGYDKIYREGKKVLLPIGLTPNGTTCRRSSGRGCRRRDRGGSGRRPSGSAGG